MRRQARAPEHDAVSGQLASIATGTAGLGVAAAAALALALARPPSAASHAQLARTGRVAAACIAAQLLHFLEEWRTGFHVGLPEMLRLEPWSSAFFVAFNVAWLAVWVACALLVERRSRALFFPLWFLGIAAAANGVVHPMLAVAARGYFPGLWTSPVIGILGVGLLRELAATTRPEGPGRSERA